MDHSTLKSIVIDSHCHIDLPAFDADRDETIKEAQDAGVERLLVPGLSISQFQQLLTLKQRHGCIDICLGLHPYFLKQSVGASVHDTFNQLEGIVNRYDADIIAIGEAGLDGSLALDMDVQIKVLEQQIVIAKQVHKPLVLHHRQSHNELIACLKKHKFKHGGVIHAFSGSYQTAMTYIDMGFYLGVGGTITYQRAKKTRATIRQIHMQHLLLETDSPDMPLNGFQGQRNTPCQLIKVAQALALIKDIELAAIEQSTTQNYYTLFSESTKR